MSCIVYIYYRFPEAEHKAFTPETHMTTPGKKHLEADLPRQNGIIWSSMEVNYREFSAFVKK